MGFIHLSIISFSLFALTVSMTRNDRSKLRQTVKDMFRHAYDSYMTYAYPADELMPLSCKGRYRDTEPHRGDVDDILGNFSMTLIDSLDSLAIFGEVKEFERGIKLVIDNVQFDNDIVVSVFETNIRVLGGLLGGHVAADVFKSAGTGMSWYHDELLEMAKDMGERLLPAFNTTTGIPYPRVNLKYGVADPRSRTGTESDTCTACAGTMIMEFGALSRLTGDPKFEAAAHKAMMALWTYRSRSSDLVGTVINIHNGEWVRRDSGVGAGIDSYYEYCLKAYILLGEEEYLQRFNQHYKAVMRYINQGSLFLNVHMNNPTRLSYSYMDSLQAFWPGLQVLKGDLKSAIELHEVFYSVAKRHTFLPEAFTASFEVHWGQHLLRPELVESTYFLYEATKDPYYLEVGKYIVENLNRYTRVPCGFAAVKDVRTLSHEDRMDSFLLSETLKYLYLLFTDKNDLPIDLHDFVFTTEAHILPLALSKWNGTSNQNGPLESEHLHDHSCPSNARDGSMMSFAEEIRRKSRSKKSGRCPKREREKTLGDGNKNFSPLLRAEQFIPGNKDHLQILKSMGISVTKTDDGKVQLMQNAALADNSEMAAEGVKFMQSMIELAKFRNEEGGAETLPRVVQILSPPYNGNIVLNAGPAQFGIDLGKSGMGVSAEVVLADPFKGCTPLNNKESADHRIVVMERGDCMFIDKVRQAEKCGAVGAIIIDNNEGSSSESQPMFAMSGDGTSSGINIPAVFLFSHEGQVLQKSMQIFSRDNEGNLRVRLADKASKKDPTSKHSTAETDHPSSPETTSSGEHQQPTSDTEPDSVDEKSEEHTAVPKKTATVGQPSPDNRQHSFNQVNKLLELMKNVVNEPGFEFLSDVKRIKSKGSVCGKTTVKRDKDKWLYDIMVANMKDKKRWEDFLVKRRTMGKAAREPLIKDKHDKDSFGVYQEKPTDGDISDKDFAGGKIDSARQMSDSSDSTFYVQSDVRDDEVFVVGTVNDEMHAANGQVVGMLSTEKTAGSVESEQPTEGEGERRAEEIEKENSPEISEVDKRQTSRIKIRQSCGDTDGTNRRKHIVCGEIITENKRETTREKDRTDMSQKTDKENREESSGSGGKNLENVEQESSQILSRRADQETSEKAYEETSKEEIEKTDKEINAEKQHRDGEFSTRKDEQRTILPTEETGEDRSESTSENSIHETRKIEEGIVSHVEISIEDERVARLDTGDNSNLENDKSDSEASDPRTNVDPELNWETKTPLNLNERANENTKQLNYMTSHKPENEETVSGGLNTRLNNPSGEDVVSHEERSASGEL